MARCPYLDYESRGALFSQGDYYCKLCGKYLKESETKEKCNKDYDEAYKNCPVYKNR